MKTFFKHQNGQIILTQIFALYIVINLIINLIN